MIIIFLLITRLKHISNITRWIRGKPFTEGDPSIQVRPYLHFYDYFSFVSFLSFA